MRIAMMAMMMAGMVVLSGCETVKSTLSGPFLGMKKDYANAKETVQNAKPGPTLQDIDAWIQRHLW